MLKIIENITGFDLEQEFNYDWQPETQNFILQDVAAIVKKFASFNLDDFLDEFIYQLTNATQKHWEYNAENSKLLCDDGKSIDIHDLNNPLRIRINGLSAAKYYIKDNNYQNVLYNAYESLVNNALNYNFEEVYTLFENLKKNYKKDIDKIAKNLDQTSSRFLKNELKTANNQLKSTLDTTFTQTSCVRECKEVLNLLDVDEFKVGLIFSDNCLCFGESLSKYGFNINSDGQATTPGNKNVYLKVKDFIDLFIKFISNPNFSNEILADVSKDFSITPKEYQKQIAEILNMVSSLNKFLLRTKEEIVENVYEDLLTKLHQKKVNGLFSKELLKNSLIVSEIDYIAFPLIEQILSIIDYINNCIKNKIDVKRKYNDNLLTSFVIYSIKRSAFLSRNNSAEKIKYINYAYGQMTQLLDAFETAKNFIRQN